MELKCEKCGRGFEKKYSLGQHIRYCQSIIKIDINILQIEYDSGLSLNELRSKYKLPRNYLQTNIKCRTISNANKLTRKKYPEKFKVTELTKDKIRKSRFEYFKLKTGNTPWEKRQRRELSYLENWFKEEILLKNNLQKKYDIVYEYAEYPYFIDFAFTNIKLAVELDGKCHFTNGQDRLQHDIDRDNILVEKGWTMYRIRYDQVNDDTISKFLNFLKNINKIEPKVYGDDLYKYADIKIKKEKQVKLFFESLPISSQTKRTAKFKRNTRADNRKIYIESQIKYIDLLLKSEIIFTESGWVGKVALIIGQKPQKVNLWMKKIMPDFYKNCFKRGKNGNQKS